MASYSLNAETRGGSTPGSSGAGSGSGLRSGFRIRIYTCVRIGIRVGFSHINRGGIQLPGINIKIKILSMQSVFVIASM